MSYSSISDLCDAVQAAAPVSAVLRVHAHHLWPDASRPALEFDAASQLLAQCFAAGGHAQLAQVRRERAVEAAEERGVGLGGAERRQRDLRYRHMFSRLALQLAAVRVACMHNPSQWRSQP